jgi:pimeloyl-ACP methyl ester carboxylesterase
MRSLYSVALAAVTLMLAGCLSDAKDPDAQPPGTGDGVPQLPQAGAAFRAQFDPLKAVMPYPNDILGFLAQPGTDGTLNLPAQALQPLAPLVNQLDGFSTNARMQANFTRRVAPASLNPGTVFLVEVAINPANKAVVGLSDETRCKLNMGTPEVCGALGVTPTGNPFLQQGVDYSVRVATDMDAGGQTVELKPLRPLNSNRSNTLTPGTENGYLMILTNGITDTNGTPAQPDTTFAQIRGGFLAGAFPLPPPAGLTAEQQLGYFIVAHLTVAQNFGLPVNNIVVTASFTTQDTTTVLQTVAEMAEAGPSTIGPVLSPVPLPDFGLAPGDQLTTNVVLALQGVAPANQPAGSGDVYVGALTVPYFLGPAVAPPAGTPGCATSPVLALCAPWVAASDGPGGSRVLSKFNPVPAKRADMPVPVLITIPNANNAAGGAKPANGWPVVIFQHGITTNRMLTFALTQPLNNLGYAVVAIDLPLHGIPQPEIDFANITPEQLGAILSDAGRAQALFRVPGVPERHFNLDLQNNATGAPGPDGNIDASGAHFINLSNGLVSRDNLRQATADLITLIRSIPEMDVDGNGPDFDGSRIHIIGMSLGAMVVTKALAFDDTAVTASLGMPGGVISDLLLDSFSFGARIEAGLIANRLTPNTSLYNNFIRDLQSLVDAGDAISHGRSAAASGVPIHFIQATGDQTVPNSASNRLAAEMKRGGLTDYDYATAGETGIAGVKFVVDPAGLTARVCFINGATHGSQVDPGGTPESLAVTQEIQAQQAVFIAGTPPALGGLPGNGRTLLFGGSMNPLAAGAYGNFTDDCKAANRPRTNVN